MPVIAGPVEATAIGSLLVQIIADGGLRDLLEARALVRSAAPVCRFEPTSQARGATDAYDRFGEVMARPDLNPRGADTK